MKTEMKVAKKFMYINTTGHFLQSSNIDSL